MNIQSEYVGDFFSTSPLLHVNTQIPNFQTSQYPILI